MIDLEIILINLKKTKIKYLGNQDGKDQNFCNQKIQS